MYLDFIELLEKIFYNWYYKYYTKNALFLYINIKVGITV